MKFSNWLQIIFDTTVKREIKPRLDYKKHFLVGKRVEAVRRWGEPCRPLTLSKVTGFSYGKLSETICGWRGGGRWCAK